ncbi:MAG: flagellin [Oscillospiraceae bacterium]|nr:flagellin [Oscillospiraceae bacterium]
MRIRNNISAMNVRRNQTNNNKKISSALEKLSSGYAINRAADDAAGLAISEKMRAQISGLDQATDNCKQGINLFRTADGALGDVTDILQRMNELCIKAGNETYGPEERQAIQSEIDNLLEEAGRISSAAKYNDMPLLNFPAKTNIDLVFIVDTTQSMDSMIENVKNNLNSYVNQLSNGGLNVRLGLVDYRDYNDAHLFKPTNFTDSLAEFEASLGNLSTAGGGDPEEAGLEAIMDGAFSLDFDADNQKVFVLVTDADLHVKGDTIGGNQSPFKYTMNEVAQKLLEKKVMFTSVSNIGNGDAKALANMVGGRFIAYDAAGFADDLMENASALAKDLADPTHFDLPLQLGDLAEDQELFRMWEVSPETLNITDVAVDPIEKLYESLAKVKAAINSVSSIRGEYGAYVNRLEHTLEAIGATLENLVATESLIRDTDMAEQMTELTKQNILSQASQAMLSQANQTPQGVLQLLK